MEQRITTTGITKRLEERNIKGFFIYLFGGYICLMYLCGMNYGLITKKRFNTIKAKSIIGNTLTTTETFLTNHSQLQKECRHNIYMEFGWTKGSVGFVNEKMTFVIMEVLEDFTELPF